MKKKFTPEEIRAQVRIYSGILRKANELMLADDSLKIGDAIEKATQEEGFVTSMIPPQIMDAMVVSLFKLQSGIQGLVGGPKN